MVVQVQVEFSLQIASMTPGPHLILSSILYPCIDVSLLLCNFRCQEHTGITTYQAITRRLVPRLPPVIPRSRLSYAPVLLLWPLSLILACILVHQIVRHRIRCPLIPVAANELSFKTFVSIHVNKSSQFHSIVSKSTVTSPCLPILTRER